MISNKNSLKKKIVVYEILFLAIIVVMGLLLRLYQIEKNPLWADELSTLSYTRNGIIATIFHNPKIASWPIHYAFVALALHFGESDLAIRLPSVIFGLLSILMIYRVAKQLFGRNVGLLSAFLLSISTFHIYYSREARWPSYFVFFSLSTLFFLLKITKSRKKTLWIIGFILSTIVNILTTPLALSVLLAEILYIIILLININNMENMKKWLIGKFKGFNITAIILVFILIGGLAIFSGFMITKYWPSLNNLYKFGPIKNEIEVGKSYSIELNTYQIPGKRPMSLLPWLEHIFGFFSAGKNLSFIVFLVPFLWGLFVLITKYRNYAVLVALWMIIPLAGFFLLDYHWFENRYVISILPVYLVIISLGSSSLCKMLISMISKSGTGKSTVKNRGFIIGLMINCLIFTVVSAKHISLNYVDRTRQDWRAVANYMESITTKNDIIFVRDFKRNFLHYYNSNSQNTNVFSTAEMNKMSTQEYRKLLAKMRDGYRLWLLTIPYFKDTIFAGIAKGVPVQTGLKDVYIGIYRLFLLGNTADDIKPRSSTWKYSAQEYKEFTSGEIVSDPQATGGFAILNGNVFGPYENIPEGEYVVSWRLQTDNIEHDKVICIIDISVGGTGTPLIQKSLKGTDFRKANMYQDFSLPLRIPTKTQLEFRIHYEKGKGNLWFDRVEVRDVSFSYSDDFSTAKYLIDCNEVENILRYGKKLYPLRYNTPGRIVYELESDAVIQSMGLSMDIGVSGRNNYLKVYGKSNGRSYELLHTYKQVGKVAPYIDLSSIVKDSSKVFIMFEMYSDKEGQLFDTRIEKIKFHGTMSN